MAVELSFHCRDVDDVLVALGSAQHERLEPRVEQEGRDGVDELHLEELHRRHVRQQHAPGVALAQIDLLEILIEPAFRKQRRLRRHVVGEQRDLRQRGGALAGGAPA